MVQPSFTLLWSVVHPYGPHMSDHADSASCPRPPSYTWSWCPCGAAPNVSPMLTLSLPLTGSIRVRLSFHHASFASTCLRDYAVLWLAAFASVMAWNAEGVSEGAKDLKLEDGAPRNCTIFKYGPEAKCSLSRVTVGFGAVILYARALPPTHKSCR